MSMNESRPAAVNAAVLMHTEVFDVFFRREVRRMIGLAVLLTGDRSTGEDIAQEAFIAALRRWDEIGRLDDPAGWVRRVVMNRSVSVIRRRIVELKAVTRLGHQRVAVSLPAMPVESEELWASVRLLPRRQMQVIVLHYAERLTLSEIANVLECSKESVNTHLRRARAALAQRLGSEVQ
jgi:RNA polymerase sigma factor (sigma-70 family)